jgi:hypothetical protein
VKFCKWVYARFPSLGVHGIYNETYHEAITFLGWDLKPEEFKAAVNFSVMLSLFLGVLLVVILYETGIVALLDIHLGVVGTLLVFMIPLVLVAVAIVMVQNYPLNEVKLEQKRALGYIPQIVGYMIMSLKLVPNLEKAVEFAAEHGTGKIADDFRRLLWDVELGVYGTLTEGLDELAYRWGKYSEEFKRALMQIRGAVLEETEIERILVLDKAMETLLAAIKYKMEQFARGLSQPSVTLFYIGVLLPLILLIILPVGAAFTNMPISRPLFLIVIYNIIIPLVVLLFARSILAARPPTYKAPEIPENYPGLPPKWKMRVGGKYLDIRVLVAIVLIVGFFGSVYLSKEGLPPRSMIGEGKPQFIPRDKTEDEVILAAGYLDKDRFRKGGTLWREYKSQGMTDKEAEAMLAFERAKFFMPAERDITPYNLIFGSIITIAVALFIYLYFTVVYRRKIQLQIMEMETEFKDSLYILASRLGENKPIEDAIDHTRKFLPKFKISERIYGRIIDNINLMGMPLEQAIFDENYGALVHIPSKTIRMGMRVMVDSVKLGVNLAARTLVSLSLQLDNSEEVNRLMKNLVSDITTMMRTIAMFIMPIILGITVALQKVVMLTIASIVTSSMAQKSAQQVSQLKGTPIGQVQQFLGGLTKPEAFLQMAQPSQFIVIIAIYIIEVCIILTYFTTKIEEDNNLLFRYNLAKTLPVALLLFVISVMAANSIIVNITSAQLSPM